MDVTNIPSNHRGRLLLVLLRSMVQRRAAESDILLFCGVFLRSLFLAPRASSRRNHYVDSYPPAAATSESVCNADYPPLGPVRWALS
jgi:hypothetical protein